MVRSRTVDEMIMDMKKRDGGSWGMVVGVIDKMLTIEPGEHITAKDLLEELSV
jgi:hypothetical protein